MRTKDVPGWFAPGNRMILQHLIAAHCCRTVLEIGTCYGLSAAWFAQRVERVTCVDLWCEIPCAGVPANVYELFLENMRQTDNEKRVTVVRADSHKRETLQQLEPSYDLIYLDGDHTYAGLAKDIAMYGPLAKYVLCGDDYSNEPPEVAGVISAVDDFLPMRQTMGRFWWVLTGPQPAAIQRKVFP